VSKLLLLRLMVSEDLYDPRNKEEENKRGYVDINNREYVRVQNEYYDEPGQRTVSTSRYDPVLDN